MPATAEVTALVPLPFNIPLSVVAPVPPAATFSVPPIVSVPDVVIAPPVNVNPVVPPDPDTEVTVPVLTDTDVFVTPVILPYASTVNTGICVPLPYVFAATPLVAKSTVIEPVVVTGLPLDVILPAVPLTVTEVTVPEPPAEIAVFVTPVILPYASTDITGTNVLLPYVFAETPLVAKSIVIEPLDVMGLPLDVILPVVPLTVTEVTVPVPPDPLLADITLPFESTVIVA